MGGRGLSVVSMAKLLLHIIQISIKIKLDVNEKYIKILSLAYFKALHLLKESIVNHLDNFNRTFYRISKKQGIILMER